jgi:hypothetical protein
VRIGIEAVPNLLRTQEQCERVTQLLLAKRALLLLLLQLPLTLALVGRETQILLVAPQHLGFGLEAQFRHQVVYIHDLIAPLIADYDEDTPLPHGEAVVHERLDLGIDFLAHNKILIMIT